MVLRTRSVWAFAALLLIASATAPAFGQDSALSEDNEVIEEEKGFLLVRKSAIPPQSVVGSNLTIVIEIHNAGSRCSSIAHGVIAIFDLQNFLLSVFGASSDGDLALPTVLSVCCAMLVHARFESPSRSIRPFNITRTTSDTRFCGP